MRRVLLLPVLALVATMFTMAPASAATITSLQVLDANGQPVTEVFAGEPVTVAWDTDTLEEGNVALLGAPPVEGYDNPDAESSGQTAPLTLEAGEYEFTITATDTEGVATDSADLTVNPVQEIPVPEIAFPDECTVVIPDADNVNFGVGFGNSGSEITERGSLDLADFFNFGGETTFGVNPDRGFAFPEGEQTTFPITVSDDCFPQLVTAAEICQGLELTNTTGGTLAVQLSGFDFTAPETELELPTGAPRTISSELDSGIVLVNLDAETFEFDQAILVDIEQDCTPASAGEAFPTVAPAAGADQASSAGATGVLAVLAVLGAALVGGRRLLRSA